MLRSMYSGISGLRNFQTKLDVIGNNIANVNTHGFKKGRVMFKDLYSQTVGGASAPSADRGGVNPRQVGLGAQLASIDTIHLSGSSQYTGITTDLLVEGDGFFIVGDPTGTDVLYTRAGQFYLDNAGNLVDSSGRYVQAIQGPDNGQDAVGSTSINIPDDATEMSIAQDGTVTYVQDSELREAGQIQIARFSNPGGLTKVGGNLYQVSPNSGEPAEGNPSEEGRGVVVSGSLEMSNVDLAEEFTEMIVAQRGFQANTRIITTSDEILQELVNLKR